jgi:AcrR family transcriptional regulator
MPPGNVAVLAETTATAAAPSRRQEHKLRTQRALQQAALDLFSEQGYDDTTTDEIAERAGVSPRTFFRYFPTKESVLFVGEYGWFQSFTKHFLAQPDELGDLEAIRQTLIELAPGLAKIRKALVLYEKAVASSVTLRGGVHDRQHDDIAAIAAAIATRRGLDAADDGCTTLATVALITHRNSLMRWLTGPANVNPADAISEGLDTLVAEMAAPARTRRREPLRPKR